MISLLQYSYCRTYKLLVKNNGMGLIGSFNRFCISRIHFCCVGL